MPTVLGLRCRECNRQFPDEALHVCDFCFGPLEVAYDYDAIAQVVSRESIEAGPRSMWRYHDLLPISEASPVDLGAGFTPLVRAERLGAELGLSDLWIKDDTANPTGSFKDRVVSVALTKARQLGQVSDSSTGNMDWGLSSASCSSVLASSSATSTAASTSCTSATSRSATSPSRRRSVAPTWRSRGSRTA